MDPSRVWWVNQDAADGGDGSEAMPYQEFTDALANVGNGEEGVIYFATPGTHLGGLVVPSGRTIALISKSMNGKVQADGVPTIDINQGATVFLGGITINGNSTGVDCALGEFWITGSTITVTGRGINTDGCSAVIQRSDVVGNSLGGIRVIAGDVGIINSMVAGDVNDQTALDILGGTADVVYSTLVAGFGTAKALNCAGGGAGSSIRNSLIVARTDNPEIVGCDQAEIGDNAIEAALAGNTSLGAMNIAWFPGAAMADFHLGMNVPATISTAATWQTGDPATDIDGDARPTVDGTPDYAGADIPN
jgi:hypothetical protein